MRAKIGDVVIDKTYNKKGNLAIVVGEGISQPILIDHNGGIARDKLRDYFAVWDGLEVIGHIDFERIWEEAVRKADRKTEPTSSKMEQVDKDINVRSKDEPQIQLTARCLNCNNAKACKENHWEGCVYEPKDEKTCETCRHWKYIAKEWQCEACKCQGYESKDEPQTERRE